MSGGVLNSYWKNHSSFQSADHENFFEQEEDITVQDADKDISKTWTERKKIYPYSGSTFTSVAALFL